jgi:hypothetical protein
MFDENFDIEKLVYVPTPTADVPMLPPGEVLTRPLRGRKGHFVKVPLEWVDRLKSAHASGTTWIVATHLLHQSFKDRRPVIRLANGALALDGISRNGKWVALRVLEELGLANIERRPRKSPIVTLLHTGGGD